MKQAFHTIIIPTHGAQLDDFTGAAIKFVRGTGVIDGLRTRFVKHTSASLTI